MNGENNVVAVHGIGIGIGMGMGIAWGCWEWSGTSQWAQRYKY